MHLSAICVLMVSIVMMARSSNHTKSKIRRTDVPAAIVSKSHAAASDFSHQLDEPGDQKASDAIPDAATTAPATEASPVADVSSQPVRPSIRLADDVKLPAVILAVMAAETNTEHPVPAPIAAAMRGIIDTFYTDLASGDGTDASQTESTEPATADDNTILVKNGPAVERARARANETYRALFGDEAFNRMTMNSMLELQSAAATK